MFREGKCLVNCDSCEDLSIDFRSGNFMRSAFGLSKYEYFWYYGWYFHVKGVDVFHVVRFDIINFCLNRCFKFQFFYFNFDTNSAVDTHLLNPLFKGCDNSRKILLMFGEFFVKDYLLFLLVLWYPLRVTFFLMWNSPVKFKSSWITHVVYQFFFGLIKISWILLSNKYIDINGEGDVGIVVPSVDRVMFSLEPNYVFVEGYITKNIVLLDL